MDKELTKANPVKALTSGLFTSSADIGKTVYISNSVSPCQEWRVADVNHDGTTGTVDLFPKYVVHEYILFNKVANSYYANSSLQSWLNNDFYNGFTEDTKSAMKVQSFPSNGKTLYDKVKCPSVNEVGMTHDRYLVYEGTIYPIFGNELMSVHNSLSGYTTTKGRKITYWTRSRDTGDYAWYVDTDCYAGWAQSVSQNYYAAIACIRF